MLIQMLFLLISRQSDSMILMPPSMASMPIAWPYLQSYSHTFTSYCYGYTTITPIPSTPHLHTESNIYRCQHLYEIGMVKLPLEDKQPRTNHWTGPCNLNLRHKNLTC
jgi:hypothetical protein